MCLVCGESRNGNIWVGGQIDFILDYLPKAGERKKESLMLVWKCLCKMGPPARLRSRATGFEGAT